MSRNDSLGIIGVLLDGQEVNLLAESGLITAIGAAVDVSTADELIDGSGKILLPPLVNGHCHAAMTLFRSRGDDLPLMRWLEDVIWPIEAGLTDEDVYWGTRLACLEMARNGISTFWDMYWRSPQVARAATDAGLRAVVGPAVIDPPIGTGPSREWLEDLDRCTTPLVSVSVAPHAIYSVGQESLERMVEVARERDLPVQIHLSETGKEVEDCISRHGLRPAHYLDRIGLLGPKTILAHGVWLDQEEMELIAGRGATIVSNPVSNQKLAVGRTFDYPMASRLGVKVGLGTDGAGSNNSLDLLADLKTFALGQRNASGDAAAVPAPTAWRIATGQESDLLGTSEPLAPGSPADFILVDGEAPEMVVGDLASNLVYSASGSVVSTLVVDGRVVSREREVADSDEILERSRHLGRKLG